MKKSRVLQVTFASALLLCACGSNNDEESDGSGGNDGSGAASSAVGGSISLGGSRSSSGGSNSGGSDGDGTCTADFAGAELQPVYLAVAFDVSGSMGKEDEPYHDPDLKWRPVVAATRGFFEDPSSGGVSAALTFFPGAEDDDRCDSDTYSEPDVAMTALPSGEFGDEIADIEPQSSDDWRGGTPTLAVVEGTFDYLARFADENPGGKYALVLVTDGTPNGCDDDSIEPVIEAVADRAAEFPTYVIGVKNPPGGPDTVTDLEDIAVAGGTAKATFIDTGDPNKTTEDFRRAVDAIRERSVSCSAAIPENPGGAPFDKSKVNVNVDQDGERAQLGYDPDCWEAGWRYDDEDAPQSIVLCPETCGSVQTTPGVKLSVAFGCDTVPVVPR